MTLDNITYAVDIPLSLTEVMTDFLLCASIAFTEHFT